MKGLRERVGKLRVGRVGKDTSGQDLLEYALAAGLVAIAALACTPRLSGAVSAVFSRIASIVSNMN